MNLVREYGGQIMNYHRQTSLISYQSFIIYSPGMIELSTQLTPTVRFLSIRSLQTHLILIKVIWHWKLGTGSHHCCQCFLIKVGIESVLSSFCTVSALRERRHTHHHLTLGKSKQEVRFLSTSSMGSSSISSEPGVKNSWIDTEVSKIEVKCNWSLNYANTCSLLCSDWLQSETSIWY